MRISHLHNIQKDLLDRQILHLLYSIFFTLMSDDMKICVFINLSDRFLIFTLTSKGERLGRPQSYHKRWSALQPCSLVGQCWPSRPPSVYWDPPPTSAGCYLFYNGNKYQVNQAIWKGFIQIVCHLYDYGWLP